jgi:hypothetical protein
MYFPYSIYLIIENTHRRTKNWLNIKKKVKLELKPLIFKEIFVIFQKFKN